MYKGAIAGVGNIAQRGHLPAYLEDPRLRNEIDIVAAVDVSAENLSRVKEIVPSLRTYLSLSNMFVSEELDFVDICSPPHSHEEIIREALENDCHIICEKPFARNLNEGRKIAEKIRENEVVFVPCHQYKYSKVWKLMKEILENGELGEVLMAQFNVFRMNADPGSAGWKLNWRVNPEISGGGIVADTGSHYFYLLSSLFGRPKRLTARTARLRHLDYPVEDTALILAEYDRAMVQINLTWAADRRENRNSIVGSVGSLWTSGDRILLSQNGEQRELHVEDVSNKATYVQWYSELLNEFLARVNNRNFSYDLLDEALDVLQWTECCYESASNATTVNL